MTTVVARASESQHWYTRTGAPQYTVTAKNGNQRNTTLASASQFQKSQADREQNRQEAAAAVSASLGAEVRIVLETLPDDAPAAPLIADAPDASADEAPPTTAQTDADGDDDGDDPHTREEEFVRTLVETLDASEEEIA